MFSVGLTITLHAGHGGFPFETKTITLSKNVPVILGAESKSDARDKSRKSSTDNGWFAYKRPIRLASLCGGTAPDPVIPLSLMNEHARIWWDGTTVYVQDLQAAFGTFVNDIQVTGAVALRANDTITLGTVVARNNKTPAYITNEELKPVIATITFS